jgi:cardiolipin synthase
MIQVVASGPDSDWPGIKMGIFHAIASARKYVYIATPYFMPNESVLMALKAAAMGGVDVRVVIPEKSDAFLTHLSTHSYIREMLDAKVRFFFYQKGFLHSKVIIIDDMVSSIGTANMDFRSFEQNYEITAFIYDEETALNLKEDYMSDLKESREVTLETWPLRPRIEKIKESFARLISPLL